MHTFKEELPLGLVGMLLDEGVPLPRQTTPGLGLGFWF